MEPPDEPFYLFVYGIFRDGGLVEKGELLRSRIRTSPKYTMRWYGGAAWVVPRGHRSILGDLYKIQRGRDIASEHLMETGCGYFLGLIKIPGYENVKVYAWFSDNRGGQEIEDGDWLQARRYRESRWH